MSVPLNHSQDPRGCLQGMARGQNEQPRAAPKSILPRANGGRFACDRPTPQRCAPVSRAPLNARLWSFGHFVVISKRLQIPSAKIFLRTCGLKNTLAPSSQDVRKALVRAGKAGVEGRKSNPSHPGSVNSLESQRLRAEERGQSQRPFLMHGRQG